MAENIGIVITGAAASGVAGLDATAAAAARADKSLSVLQNTGKRLPEMFAKGRAAMLGLGVAASGMGGKVGAAAGQVSQLASLLSVGGPIGIGLAAAAGAVALGSKLWETYTLASRNSEAAVRSLDAVIQASTDRMKGYDKQVEDAKLQLKNFGLTAAAVAAITATEVAEGVGKSSEAVAAEVEQRKAALAVMEQELARRQAFAGAAAGFGGAAIDALRDQISEERKGIATMEAGVAAGRKRIDTTKHLADTLAELERKTKAAERATRAEMEAQRAAEEQARAADEARKAAEREAETMAQGRAERIIASTQARADADRVATDAIVANLEREQAAREQMAGIGIQLAGDLAVALIESSGQGAQAMAMAVVSAMQTAVMAAASGAAAQAAFSQAGIPIIGPILATTAAGVMFAFVRKFLATMPKAAAGGEIRGGTWGRDSVPAMLMPGERVLTVRENASLKSFARGLSSHRIHAGTGAALGGEPAPGAGVMMPSVKIVAQIQTPEEMTQAQLDRWLVRISKRVERLHRDGLFLRSAAVM